MLRWSGGEPAMIGGDMNTRTPSFPGFDATLGGHVLDHVFARGFHAVAPAQVLPRHDARLDANLSDHAPVLVRAALG